MSDFHFTPVCTWSETKGFESLAAGGKDKDEADESEEDEENGEDSD